MIYVFNEIEINYKFLAKKGKSVNLFLHGWGESSSSFDEIVNDLSNFSWLCIDLPPFGKSQSPENWIIFTYVNMIKCLLRNLKIERCNIIGHSFGGRLAILLASENLIVDKLVLLSSAGMKPRKTIKKRINKIKFKFKKFFSLDTKRYYSKDYLALDDKMKSTFISIVSTHLEEYASMIDCETLIIFGKDDTETPVYMGAKLNRLIEKSKLVLLENTGHFCFLENKLIVENEIKKFLN